MRKLISIVLLFVVACSESGEPKPEGPKAPPGTIITKRDGVDLKPATNLIANAHDNTGGLTVNGWFVIDVIPVQYDGISIYLKNPAKGEFVIKGNCFADTEPGYVFFTSAPNVFYTWKIADNSSGKVNITKLDLTNKLVSGTFEVKLQNDAGTVTELTDGSFTDLKID